MWTWLFFVQSFQFWTSIIQFVCHFSNWFLRMQDTKLWPNSRIDLFVDGNMMLNIIAVMFDVLHSMRLDLYCWILLILVYLTSLSAMQIAITMKYSIMIPKACLLCLTMVKGVQQCFETVFVGLRLGSCKENQSSNLQSLMCVHQCFDDIGWEVQLACQKSFNKPQTSVLWEPV